MAQHDYNIANGSGLTVRSDINDVLSAIVTHNSGAAAPSTTFAYQFWYDTTANILKIRNAANSAWVNIGAINSTVFDFDRLNPFVQATAQNTTSGTSIDFTSIPSWVKKISVVFSGVSTNGASPITIQLGDSGGIETTGYSGAGYLNTTSPNMGGTANTVGFNMMSAAAAGNNYTGIAHIIQLNSNTWIAQGFLSRDDVLFTSGAGAKTLSATLDRVRITTVNGTDAFDAGSVNILYE